MLNRSSKVLGVVVLMLVVLAEAAPAADRFAALAFSRRLARVSGANNASSLQQARDESLRACGHHECYVAIVTKNGCVSSAFSYVADQTGIQWHGFAHDLTAEAAERHAVQICEYNAHDFCFVHTTLCTRVDQPEETPITVEQAYLTAPERSPEAIGILKVVNLYHSNVLREKVFLSEKVTARLRDKKGNFGTIAVLVRETEIGAGEWDRLLGFARTEGYIKP